LGLGYAEKRRRKNDLGGEGRLEVLIRKDKGLRRIAVP